MEREKEPLGDLSEPVVWGTQDVEKVMRAAQKLASPPANSGTLHPKTWLLLLVLFGGSNVGSELVYNPNGAALERLSHEVSVLSSKVSELQGTVRDNQGDVGRLKQDMEARAAELRVLQSRTSSMKANIAVLLDRLPPGNRPTLQTME